MSNWTHIGDAAAKVIAALAERTKRLAGDE